jgi:predicted aconitase with swiveling domain
VQALQSAYAATDEVDVVVFSAPQLSLYELRRIADLCDGRHFVKPLLAVTSPQVKPDADRFGYTERIEGAGGQVLSACASTSPMRARSPKRTAGSGSRPTARSSSTSSAATATCRCSRRWSSASKPPKRGGSHERRCGGYVSRAGAPREFTARHAIGAKVRGIALVAHDGFSARYDLDRIAGTFSRPAHKLVGQSYVGKVLVLDTAKGGVASAWMLREMASRGVVPLAIVFNSVNPILVQGAAFGDVTMLAGFDGDITAAGPQRRDRRDRSGGPAASRALARSPPARERARLPPTALRVPARRRTEGGKAWCDVAPGPGRRSPIIDAPSLRGLASTFLARILHCSKHRPQASLPGGNMTLKPSLITTSLALALACGEAPGADLGFSRPVVRQLGLLEHAGRRIVRRHADFTLTCRAIANGSVTTVGQRQPGSRLRLGRAERPSGDFAFSMLLGDPVEVWALPGSGAVARCGAVHADPSTGTNSAGIRLVRRQLRGDADLAGARSRPVSR